MIRVYKLGDKVFYDMPNVTSCNHITFEGRVLAFEHDCMSCADGTPSYLVETQYGPRIVCETVLRRDKTNSVKMFKGFGAAQQ